MRMKISHMLQELYLGFITCLGMSMLQESMIFAVAEFFGNVELCRFTEQVVFSDPYRISEYNRWTSPYLNHEAVAVQEDNILKLEVAELKSKYGFFS
ncbi:hypothetical protein PTKIN_Ptkin11bG0089100 [Pterospermum kingtungense]